MYLDHASRWILTIEGRQHSFNFPVIGTDAALLHFDCSCDNLLWISWINIKRISHEKFLQIRYTSSFVETELNQNDRSRDKPVTKTGTF